MASGIICQSCGIEAPTREVDFHQNIGALVVRFRRRVNGMLCKRCVHKHFWKMTGTTLLLGPWGYISVIIAPCFIINNVVRYLMVIGMPPVPPGAAVPTLDQNAIAQLQPLTPKLIERLNNKEPLATVATGIAQEARVTPGQVVKYVVALSQSNVPAAPPPGPRGFPVRLAPPMPVLPVEPVVQVEPPATTAKQAPSDIGLT